jgi:ATP-dependent helicase/nuclease subunit A
MAGATRGNGLSGRRKPKSAAAASEREPLLASPTAPAFPPGGRVTPSSVIGLTDEQRRAIEARRVSVALSAGAGCGKTFVLTQRFLSHLDPSAAEPARLPELVAITFTDRAAREMRDRIRKTCHQRLIEADNDRNAEHWLRLLRELDSARVSTIHSFCGSLLRSHAVEAGLDPRFRTLEAAQAATLLAELIDDELRRQLTERRPAAMDLVVYYGLNTLRRHLSRLLTHTFDLDYEQWLARTPEELLERWSQYHREHVLPCLLRRISEGPAASTAWHIINRCEPNHPVMQERFAHLRRLLPRLPESADPAADLAALREHARVQGGGSKKAWETEEQYESFKNASEELRGQIDKVRELIDFDAQAARPAAVAGLQLLEVARPIARAYAAEKRELGCLDFDDLLVRARDLLCGPRRANLRRAIASQIKLLLVDEFQDTDPLQVELVKALCDDDVPGGKLFFVGDYKQSIYRFRRADPQVFRALSSQVPVDGQLPLSQNFRSQPAILSFVNALFRDDLGASGTGVPPGESGTGVPPVKDGTNLPAQHRRDACATEAKSRQMAYEPLRPHRPQVSPTPAVEFLWAPAENAGQKEQADDIRLREAEWIARRLRAILDSGAPIVWDAESAARGAPSARPAKPGDIALLFRALSNIEQYEDALRRYDLDYYLVGGKAFYAQQEIYDLLNLLRAVASPCDEVSLAGALRSPFFSLADETLFWLAQHRDGLAAGLLARDPPPQLAAPERRRVRFAAETLSLLRARKDRVPIADLIHEALARTGYDAVLLTEFLGERKLANLRKLIDQARTFDRSAIFTLDDFITQLSEFVASEPDEPLAATHPESTNVVRLMSIHAAKGLEFPIVVVPDLARKQRASGEGVAFDPQLGPLVKPPAAPSGRKRFACGLDLRETMEAEEEEAERNRLLYVATTRAADYLILSSGVQRLDKPDAPWMRLVARRFCLQTGRCLAALPDDYTQPEVLVTRTEPPPPADSGARRCRPNLAELIERATHLAEQGEGRCPRFAASVPPDGSARRQFSFSRLHGALELIQPALDSAEQDEHLAASPRIDPLELGTLVHAILADIPFGEPVDVAALARRHAARNLATDEATLREAASLVSRFLKSPRAATLAEAAATHVELEFLLAWPPQSTTHNPCAARSESETLPPGADAQSSRHTPCAVRSESKDSPPRDALSHGTDGTRSVPVTLGEYRYLQGFIDCLYQDAAGAWHLLDYKTNQVAAATLAAVAAGYEMQMFVYALAAERIFKAPVASLTLHFLRPNLEHQFNFDPQRRLEMTAAVTQAMDALAH